MMHVGGIMSMGVPAGAAAYYTPMGGGVPVVMQPGMPAVPMVAVQQQQQQGLTWQQQQWMMQQQQGRGAVFVPAAQQQQQQPQMVGGQHLTWQQQAALAAEQHAGGGEEAEGEDEFYDAGDGEHDEGSYYSGYSGDGSGSEQQQQRGRNTGAGSSRAALLAAAGDVRNLSLSPSSKVGWGGVCWCGEGCVYTEFVVWCLVRLAVARTVRRVAQA